MYMRPCWSHTREPSPRTGMNGAGAKHGTISWSNIARVTGSGATPGAARVPAGSDAVEVEGTAMQFRSYCAAMTWISIL